VFQAAASSYRRLLVEWVDLVRRSASWVIVLAMAVTAAAVWFTATHVGINTDTTDMLSPDLEFRRHSRALSAAFPQFSDNILVVIDGDNPDLVDDAAALLSERLRQQPELFGSVFDAADDPFFRKNGLLYLDIDELAELADRLAEAQPFLGALWRDPSLRGLFGMLGRILDEAGKGDTPMEIDGVLDAVAEIAEARAEGRFARLSWRELMMGRPAEKSERRRLVLIQPALNFASLQPAADAMDALRDVARELRLTPANGVRVRLTGSAALAQEELKSVEEGMGLAAVLSLCLVVGLLLIGLKSLRLAGAILVTLVMGLVWTATFAVLAVGELNLISVAFAVLFIGLSVDFGIHFGLRYREAIDGGAANGDALREAAEGVGGALTLCAVAAAIGFFSFLPTDYLGLAELGLIAGAGMFIALFANVTMLPAILAVAPVSPGRGSGGRARRSISRRRGMAIAVAAVAIGVAAATLLPRARFDFDPLNLKDPETESAATLFDMMDDPRTSPYSITVLAPDLDSAAELGARLARLEVVDETATLADYVPGGQEEKLEVIADMALFLAPSLATGERKPAPDAKARGAALEALRQRLAKATQPAARRLAAALAGLDGSHEALADLETRLLSTLHGRLRALAESLEAGPVTLDHLPADIRDRQVAADGRAKVEVYPRENLHDRAALERFVTAVRTVAPNATGAPVVILEAGNTVVAAFRDAALLAMAAIVLLLAAILRTVRDVLLVFAPLVLAALLTVAASVVAGLPFNFANVIVLPLLFGLGVANGIHLIVRERDEAGVTAVMDTSTPRAVVFSALTTMGSFGSIALSSHPGTSSMGMLLTIAITLTLVCTLVVLPALMVIVPKKGKAP
jgi:uncharacterized protein